MIWHLLPVPWGGLATPERSPSHRGDSGGTGKSHTQHIQPLPLHLLCSSCQRAWVSDIELQDLQCVRAAAPKALQQPLTLGQVTHGGVYWGRKQGSRTAKLLGQHRPQPTPRHQLSLTKCCLAQPGRPPGVPVPPPAQRYPFTFEPASGVGRQACSQPQADARRAACDQHRSFLHEQAVPAKGTVLFKKAGRTGSPRPTPRVLCLPSYLKAPPPTSLRLDACAAAAKKTPRSQDPPAGGGSAAQGEPQPRGLAPARASTSQGQHQPCRVVSGTPAASTHLAVHFSCYGDLGAKHRSSAPHFAQVPRWGEEMDTDGRKECSAARPLIAPQAGSTTAGLCLSPSCRGKA